MCELLMIRKIVLGDEFTRKIWRVKKTALGTRLIEPSVSSGTLALKVFVGIKEKVEN